MTRRRVRLVGALGLAVVTLLGLAAAGRGTLATPPLTSWTAAEAWYDRTGAGPAAVTVIRLLAMLGATWLASSALLQLVAPVFGAGAVQRLADSFSPSVLRPVARGVAGFSISAGLALPSMPVRAADDPPGTAVMEVVVDEAVATTAVSIDEPTPRPAPPAVAAPTSASPRPDEVRVEVGDSFWTLAVGALADTLPDSSDREVVQYWERLIELNRDRLTDASNPDLLYPGMLLELPSIP